MHEEIVDRIVNALNSRHSDMKDVAVSVQGGAVLLDGKVRSFYAKQMAQVLTKHIPGVRQIVNRVHVQQDC
ncbi:MAG: BON domain-containing protein [Planctomycetaceae bacterium]|nr:BON domain-containing protein [Planctomycetaceae bacterium]